MIYLLTNGWSYVHIPKNACTSIDQHRVDNKTRPVKKLLAVIRNPYDRLVSAFEDKFDMEWDDFIDYVCNTPDKDADAHVKSQTSYFIAVQAMPDKLISFDNMQEEFREIGIELEHLNPSIRKEWPTYYTEDQLKRVRERYDRDFKLWEVATT